MLIKQRFCFPPLPVCYWMQLAIGEQHALTFVPCGQHPRASTGVLPLQDKKLLCHILNQPALEPVKYLSAGGDAGGELTRA